MPLDTATINNFITSIETARDTGTVQDEITAIGSYYQYLANEGVVYGSLARDTALNQGDFGSFANDYLLAAGANKNTADNVRLELALEDARLRIVNLNDAGIGIIPPSQIASYHYNIFENNSLPRHAWAGSLFEEFAGTGSWMEVAQGNGLPTFTGIELAASMLFGSVNNGVDARIAASLLFEVGQSLEHLDTSMGLFVSELIDGFIEAYSVGVYTLVTGISWGDPHLVTFDGLNYDFQAPGEFVLVESTDPSMPFEIQVRHELVPGSNSISLNKATAMDIDGYKVGVYVEPNNDPSSNSDFIVMQNQGTIDALEGNDTVFGSNQADDLTGGAGSDILTYLVANDDNPTVQLKVVA